MGTIWALIPAWLKVLLAAAIAALLSFGVGYWRGDANGYDRRIAEIAIKDGKAELERKGDDAALQRLSDYDLCVVGLRSNRMPVKACERLRGVSEEQSVPSRDRGADPG